MRRKLPRSQEGGGGGSLAGLSLLCLRGRPLLLSMCRRMFFFFLIQDVGMMTGTGGVPWEENIFNVAQAAEHNVSFGDLLGTLYFSMCLVASLAVG